MEKKVVYYNKLQKKKGISIIRIVDLDEGFVSFPVLSTT